MGRQVSRESVLNADSDNPLTAEGVIDSFISHDNLIRYTVDLGELQLNADVVYGNHMSFETGERVYVTIRRDQIIGL